MRILSKIQIEGDTEFSKDKITQQILNLVQGRLSVLKKEIHEINIDLDSFKERFSMSNEIFLTKFQNGKLGDNSEYFVWKGSLELLDSLTEEVNMLREVL